MIEVTAKVNILIDRGMKTERNLFVKDNKYTYYYMASTSNEVLLEPEPGSYAGAYTMNRSQFNNCFKI